jgi:5-methylthioadenosine/S-adenosylhomocysteine deaminase
VYAARGTDVTTTVVDGEVLVENGASVRLDPGEVIAEARQAVRDLVLRAGL